jgi:hypothetical protein
MSISITKPQPDRGDWTLEIRGCRHFMDGDALAELHHVLVDHFIAQDKARCAEREWYPNHEADGHETGA